jgi:hypothetical protein
MKHKMGAFLLLLSLGPASAYCQNATSTVGGEAYGNNGVASYSIGQTVYTSQIGTNGSVSQGVQQAFEISQVLGLEEASGINLLMSVYPNPATNNLTLQVENYPLEQLTYTFYDSNGRVLEEKAVVSIQTNINVNGIPSSIYFLKVNSKNKEIKIFKIIKK